MVKRGAKDLKKKDDEKLFAFLASFLTIIGFIIALVLRRESKYVMFYAKQGLILFIGQLIITAVQKITVAGWSVIMVVISIFWIILWVITWINALSGEQKETWLIGELAAKINL